MVTPVGDEPKKMELDLTGEDFTGLVQSLKVITHLVETESAVDILLDDFMKNNKKLQGVVDRDTLKAGFAFALHVLGSNLTHAAKTAKVGWDREHPEFAEED